jgi:hypothetical protein
MQLDMLLAQQSLRAELATQMRDGFQGFETRMADYMGKQMEQHLQIMQSFKLNVETAVQSVKQDLQQEIVASSTRMEQKFDTKFGSVEARLAKLESAPAGPPPPLPFPSARADAAVASGVPHGISFQSSRPRRAPRASDFDDPPFLSRKVFLKGWCTYEQESTLVMKFDDLRNLWNGVEPQLSEHARGWLEKAEKRLWAPRYKNRQLTVNISQDAPIDAAFRLQNEINVILKQDNITRNAKPVFASRDQEPWKKARNGALFKASGLLEDKVAAGERIHKDWDGGTLYLVQPSGDVVLGFYKRDEGWAWFADNLRNRWPDEDLAALEASMAVFS